MIFKICDRDKKEKSPIALYLNLLVEKNQQK